MSRNWTPAQLAAMSLQGKNLLVSAAAGSGKTATLTERIIRRITDPNDPADISSMLVVTFTRAAAADLKAKMFSAMSEALAANPQNTHLSSQLMKLSSAHICTIDSFYTDLVRSHFSELGLPSSFRIADAAELAVLSEELMDEVIEEAYTSEPSFPLLVECFGKVRNQRAFREVLIRLYNNLCSHLSGISFLFFVGKKYAEMSDLDFFQSLYGHILQLDTVETVEHAYNLIQKALDILDLYEELEAKYGPALRGDEAICQKMISALDFETGSYDAVYHLLQEEQHLAIGRQRVEKSEVTEFLTSTRKEVKALFDNLRSKSFSKHPSSIKPLMEQTGFYVIMLYDLLKKFDERLTEEKHQRGVLDFNDIRHYSFKLLISEDGTPTELAHQYASTFREIYIDEYQDVDKLQDVIFAALSNGHNRFMVGDIKQSIYRFRGAEPDVFANYRQDYPEHNTTEAENADGMTVYMSNNFRCDRPIIDFTNAICSYLFKESPVVDYCDADNLVYSRQVENTEYKPSKVKVTVILPPEAQAEESSEILEETNGLVHEAKYIASEIERLISSETKADGTPIRPGDIAILVRSNRVKAFLTDALRERNIPLSDDDSSRYFENPDVQMMLCLLGTVDNPRRDIDLVGTLRSPIFGFDMNDLLRIRLNGDPSISLYDALLDYAKGEDALALRCQAFRDILSEWRDSARSLSVDRFLRQIFDSEPFLASGLLTQISPEGAGGNLLRLYEYARTFEAGGFRGLYQFIEFIHKVIDQKKDLKIPQKGGSSDAVSLMTIHHSKGLEFPVCFVAGMGSAFSRRENKESLALDHHIGIAFKLSDGTGFAQINTPMREAILSYIRRHDTEEEMRVLYVALTRARERLYVTGYTKSDEETLLQQVKEAVENQDAYSVFHAPSFLFWILSGLEYRPYEEHCELRFLSADQIQSMQPKKTEETQKKVPNADPEEVKRLKEAFSYVYPYADFSRIPSKISVSKLSPDVLDEQDTAKELFGEAKATIPDFFLPDSPTKSSATERGTATHLFLQFCDFSFAAKHGVKEELARLTERRFIPENASKLVYEEELSRFLESELAELILKSKKIYREQRFNLLLSPASFTKDAKFLAKLGTEEKLAVQGVIDLILIDREDRLLLIDYKTDRLTKEELASDALAQRKLERAHGRQLSYYAKATELLFGRPCDRLCVYSTHAAKLFDLSPLDLAETESLW